MNLVFILRSLVPGGAERQLSLLARGLQGRGHLVHVLTFYPGDSVFEGSVTSAGVRVVCLGKRSRWDLCSSFAAAASICRQLQPQAICGWMPAENLLAMCLARFVAHVPIIWALRASGLDFRGYDIGTRGIYALQRLLIRKADLVVANSMAGLSAQGLSLGHRGIAILDNIVDGRVFAPNALERASFRRELGLAEAVPLVGIVGRLDPMKDHPTFIDAMAKVIGQRPDVRVVIVGRGSAAYVRAVHELAAAMGLERHVIWLDFVRDVSRVYNGLDVLVSTSAFGEGVQNSLLEAMACGTAVVATDVGDAQRIVSSADEVVPAKDPDSVARAVMDAMDRNSSVLVEERREHVLSRFSEARILDTFEELLRATVPRE